MNENHFLENARQLLHNQDFIQWRKEVIEKPKLRFFRKIYSQTFIYKPLQNVYMNLSKSERLHLAQRRIGI